MQVGIDSFAAAFDENSRAVNPSERLRQLVQQISRISFQMNAASLPQVKMMRAIDAIGARVLPALAETHK